MRYKLSPVLMVAAAAVWSVLLSMVIFSTSAIAADPEYLVEVIIFENRSGNDGGERWLEAGVPPVRDAVRLANNKLKFTQLDPDQLELAGVANSLARSGNYRVLYYKGWKQPGFSRQQAKPLRVGTGADQLDGTIRLERGRYLHLYIDLALFPRMGLTGTMPIRLTQQRRVRKTELHYFDHPKFGVLATVRSPAS